MLALDAPKDWKVELDRFGFGRPFPLAPRAEVLVGMKLTTPGNGAAGTVQVTQETTVGRRKLLGGLTFELRPPGHADYTALSGLSLVADPVSGGAIGYQPDGSGFALRGGDTIAYAPVQLQHGSELERIRCVALDATKTGHLQVSLNRGPIDVTQAAVPFQLVASTSTSSGGASKDFQELSGAADAAAARIDNDRYGYFFRVEFLGVPEPAASQGALRLRGCSVEYHR